MGRWESERERERGGKHLVRQQGVRRDTCMCDEAARACVIRACPKLHTCHPITPPGPPHFLFRCYPKNSLYELRLQVAPAACLQTLNPNPKLEPYVRPKRDKTTKPPSTSHLSRVSS
jgi:hypothetical protein